MLVAVGLLKVKLKPMFASLTHLTPTNEKPVEHDVQKVADLMQVAQLTSQIEQIPLGILLIMPIRKPFVQLVQT